MAGSSEQVKPRRTGPAAALAALALALAAAGCGPVPFTPPPPAPDASSLRAIPEYGCTSDVGAGYNLRSRAQGGRIIVEWNRQYPTPGIFIVVRASASEGWRWQRLTEHLGGTSYNDGNVRPGDLYTYRIATRLYSNREAWTCYRTKEISPVG